ncbi:MAG TPA: GNAT family N-acetyltransferase [Candidatus Binatia bacterium]|nr:GNAT family N-acetyltransferase [Candidatus Binatia bacterium]
MGPFSTGRPDRFEEWLRAPAPLESTHPRFDVRRAIPSEFDAIYDLVDDSFGVRRSRALYDWLYRHNPYGPARCWVVIDRASGRVVGSTASWPWPMARGTQAIDGIQAGDWVIAPAWQRQGISELRSRVRESHAWQDSIAALSWPNEKSRGSGIKRGRREQILGPVPKVVLMLDAKAYLAQRGWPTPIRVVAGGAADAAAALWRTAWLRAQRDGAVEPVRRFDSHFDAVTERCMLWQGLWSPHAAEFLNWRYLDRPEGRYAAFAITKSDVVLGYYVLKYETPAAWLMEFVAPAVSRNVGAALVRHMIATARAAGCAYVKFSAPPSWRHWRLFYAAGFVHVPSEIYMWPGGELSEVLQLDHWQWVPGDMDEL